MIADLVMASSAASGSSSSRIEGSVTSDLREGDALLLTAGNFCGLAPGQSTDAHLIENGGGALPAGTRGQLGEAILDILLGGEMREEGKILKHEADRSLRGWPIDFRRGIEQHLQSSAIRPGSGDARPAMELSRVVFPEPERPNKIVKPAGAVKLASRMKFCAWLARMSTESVATSW